MNKDFTKGFMTGLLSAKSMSTGITQITDKQSEANINAMYSQKSGFINTQFIAGLLTGLGMCPKKSTVIIKPNCGIIVDNDRFIFYAHEGKTKKKSSIDNDRFIVNNVAGYSHNGVVWDADTMKITKIDKRTGAKEIISESRGYSLTTDGTNNLWFISCGNDGYRVHNIYSADGLFNKDTINETVADFNALQIEYYNGKLYYTDEWLSLCSRDADYSNHKKLVYSEHISSRSNSTTQTNAVVEQYAYKHVYELTLSNIALSHPTLFKIGLLGRSLFFRYGDSILTERNIYTPTDRFIYTNGDSVEEESIQNMRTIVKYSIPNDKWLTAVSSVAKPDLNNDVNVTFEDVYIKAITDYSHPYTNCIECGVNPGLLRIDYGLNYNRTKLVLTGNLNPIGDSATLLGYNSLNKLKNDWSSSYSNSVADNVEVYCGDYVYSYLSTGETTIARRQ